MNIKEAKQDIKNTITAYFTKDSFGNYVIPIEKQRPAFLMGPPGIGKTAIMEQIASELGVALVTYSMTHHTRQSALGLPFIVKKVFGGKEYSVSEYTMSEIIASVYDTMEKTGLKEGILFLDEINCVSETLAPAMLQFLQYKIFGRHRVPEGWIVVTAGNPPEYNNSVREFDIVTWDRLKHIDVEPDYNVWKEYAYKKSVHAAITTFLDIKSDRFYRIETTVDGKSFVTARGWSDLSDIMKLYEQNNIEINEKLIIQYVQNRQIAKEFAIYYDLFNKYRSDYQIEKILNGTEDESIATRAIKAKFDERLSLLGLIIDAISQETKDVFMKEKAINNSLSELKKIILDIKVSKKSTKDAFSNHIAQLYEKIEHGKMSSVMSSEDIQATYMEIENLNTMLQDEEIMTSTDAKQAMLRVKKYMDKFVGDIKKISSECTKKLSNAFKFCEKTFGDGQEILILVTELTINVYTSNFISHYGCKEYFNHNKELMFYDRQKELINEINSLEEII